MVNAWTFEGELNMESWNYKRTYVSRSVREKTVPKWRFIEYKTRQFYSCRIFSYVPFVRMETIATRRKDIWELFVFPTKVSQNGKRLRIMSLWWSINDTENGRIKGNHEVLGPVGQPQKLKFSTKASWLVFTLHKSVNSTRYNFWGFY
jgi:hypothetical protein